jgi:hypothetical protein
MFRYKAKAESGEIFEGEVQALGAVEAMIEVRWLVGPHGVILQLWQA